MTAVAKVDAKLLAALELIPFERSGDVGKALYAAGYDLNEWLLWGDWLAPGEYPEIAPECTTAWGDFPTADRGRNPNAVFELAEEYGWIPARPGGAEKTSYDPNAVYYLETPIAEWLARGDATGWQLPYIGAEGAITLITGPSKAGKTQLIFGMLSEALQRNRAIDQPVAPGLTVKIWTEERNRTLSGMIERTRLAGQMVLGQQQPPWDVCGFYDLQTHDWGRMVDAAGGLWVSDGPPDVLVVDTLGRWTRQDDWNDYAQTMRSIEPLGKLSAAFPRLAIIVVHHARKSGGDAIQSALGSMALTAAVDNVISLEVPADADEYTRVLRFSGRITPDGLVDNGKWVKWDPSTGWYSSTQRTAHTEGLIDDVLVDAETSLTPAEIHELIPLDDRPSISSVKAALRRGYDAGRYLREGSRGRNGFRYWLSVNADGLGCG